MWLRRVVPTLLLMLLTLALAAPAMADARVRIVRLSYLDGDVQIDRRDGQGFENAMMNLPVVQGTRLWTREEGLAEVELEDGSTIRLTPHTLIEAQELALRGGDTVNLFDMQEGTAYFDIHGDDDNNFVLALPGHQLRLRKGSRFRVTAQSNELRVSVFKGEVELSGAAASHVVVKKGESVALDPFENGRYFLSRDIVSEYYDTWDEERDEYRERYARHNSYSGYSNVYYGATDLHYWGNYNYIPGWGWMWRPYYVGAAWNPWMDGAWVWYPGWGYTWVSAYPWGWMPYHYGSWVFVPTTGWCWRPGGWNSWRHHAVAYNSPSGFRVPLPPHRGGGRVVVVGGGGKTVYPREDRGFFGAVKAAKDAANGVGGNSRPLVTGSKGTRAGDTDTFRTGTKTHDGLGNGRKTEVVGGRTDTDRNSDTMYRPRTGRTVMDSRRDPDENPDRTAEPRGERTNTGTSGGSTDTGSGRQWTPRKSEGSSDTGRGSNVGGGSSRDSGMGRSTGGRQDSQPPSRTSPPPPAPPARQASPPPPRTAPPARETSPSRSTPSSGMSFSSSRSYGSRSMGSSGGTRMSSPSSGSRAASGRPRSR